MIKLMLGAVIGFFVAGLCRAAKDYVIECPMCGQMPTLKQVGDNKDLYVVECPYCDYCVADSNEAQTTPDAAFKLWNIKVNKEN